MADSAGFKAWIADDGELDAVRALLTARDVEVLDRESEPPARVDLLVTSPRYTMKPDPRSAAISSHVHIVMAQKLTRSLEQHLQRMRCDFIVTSDIHPVALGLLVEYALYSGPERRERDRAVMSVPVQIKVGWRQRKATLIQLSEQGCGASFQEPLSGDKLTLRLPAEWTRGEKIEIPLRVLDCGEALNGEHTASFRFTKVDPKVLAILRAAVRQADEAVGILKPNATAPPKAAASAKNRRSAALDGPENSSDEDRRRSARANYRRQVLATSDGRSHVVLGRDISTGGMRIGHDPSLQVGQDLKLALYGSGRRDRIIVRARIVRDAGADGLGIEFRGLKPEMKERIAKLVDGVQVLGRTKRGQKRSPNVVVSEILDEEANSEGG